MTFNAAQAMVTVICIMVLIVLLRLLKYQNQRLSLLPSLFLPVFVACYAIALP
jgi:hypothetical protein